MKKKSCLTNLLEYLETLHKLLDEGNSVDIVYCDFAKAFDKVPIRRLLVKMEAHGITGKVLEWVEQWLTGRKQRVVLNGKKSGWSEVTSGVVQGSCLGPTLFLTLINTIDNAMDTTTAIISKFADDTKAGRVVENEDDRAKLQEEINNQDYIGNTFGLWVIENEDFRKGGMVAFENKYRLKQLNFILKCWDWILEY